MGEMALELEQEDGGVNMIYSIFSYVDNMTFSANCIFIKEKRKQPIGSVTEDPN